VTTSGAIAVGTGLLAAAALAQAGPSVAVLGQWTPLRRVGRCIWRGPAAGAALTFDDGPSPHATPALLDLLDELGVPATFFCNGEAVLAQPELVRDAVLRGHQVETHGFRHRHHLFASPRWIAADLEASVRALRAAGVQPHWFRPPYGQLSAGTVLAARRAQLGLALWSTWGREWDAPDSGAVAGRVIAGMEPGAVVLLHDSDASSPVGSAERACRALAAIADEAARRHLPLVRLDELIGGVSG
jgi:peptidoglycan-N-acetylglucosamine deacetylase